MSNSFYLFSLSSSIFITFLCIAIANIGTTFAYTSNHFPSLLSIPASACQISSTNLISMSIGFVEYPIVSSSVPLFFMLRGIEDTKHDAYLNRVHRARGKKMFRVSYQCSQFCIRTTTTITTTTTATTATATATKKRWMGMGKMRREKIKILNQIQKDPDEIQYFDSRQQLREIKITKKNLDEEQNEEGNVISVEKLTSKDSDKQKEKEEGKIKGIEKKKSNIKLKIEIRKAMWEDMLQVASMQLDEYEEKDFLYPFKWINELDRLQLNFKDTIKNGAHLMYVAVAVAEQGVGSQNKNKNENSNDDLHSDPAGNNDKDGSGGKRKSDRTIDSITSPLFALFSPLGPFASKLSLQKYRGSQDRETTTHTEKLISNEIVGFVDMDARQLRLDQSTPVPYISDLIISKSYRHSGIGSMLMKECELVCKEGDRTASSSLYHDWRQYQYLYLKVRSNNNKALNFYIDRLGYYEFHQSFAFSKEGEIESAQKKKNNDIDANKNTNKNTNTSTNTKPNTYTNKNANIPTIIILRKDLQK